MMKEKDMYIPTPFEQHLIDEIEKFFTKDTAGSMEQLLNDIQDALRTHIRLD